MKKISIICVCFIASIFAGRLNAQESFSGSERFLKINEPYVSMALFGNNDKVAAIDLPTWGISLGDRHIYLHKATGLFFDLDAAVEYGMLKENDNGKCFSTSGRLSFSFGYSYFFSKSNPVASLSLSVGIGADYSVYVFSYKSPLIGANHTLAPSYYVPQDGALYQRAGFVPVRLKLSCEDASIALTYRLTFAQHNKADNMKIGILPFEISAGIPLDLKRLKNAYIK